MILPQSLQVPINAVANDLGVPVEWLINLIAFESNFDPKAANPYSSAKGLIQFIDETARSLGYQDSQDLIDTENTFSKQMYGPVLTYLRRYAPYASKGELYMSVFYPAYRNSAPDREFPQYVQDVNPGIVTIQDYVDKVDAMGQDVVPAAGAFAAAITDHSTTWKLAGIAAALAAVWYISTRV